MFTLEQINDHIVKPIRVEKDDPKTIKGYYDTIPSLYATIVMLATVKSGKTTAMFDIIKSCSNKNTIVIFFGSTIYNDGNYKVIFKYLKKKGNPIMKFTSIVEDGVDQLKEIMDALKGEESDDDDSEEEDDYEKVPKSKKYIEVDPDSEEEVERKPRKSKYKAPDVIFVFDDLSKELRIPIFNKFIKSFRHYRAKAIICTHYSRDIEPDSRKNIQYLMLFRGFLKDDPDDKKKEGLIQIHADFPIRLSYSKFRDLYEDATSEDFSFLFVDIHNNIFRKSFNSEYIPV